MRRAIPFLFLFLILSVIANLSFAEETAVKEAQGEIDSQALSTTELEERLDEVEEEIDELETRADYLKTEEPEDFDYAAGTVERSGFEAEAAPKSRLLNPTAAKDTKVRLDSLYIIKKVLEKELDKRGQRAR